MQSIPLPLSSALKEASKHNPGLLVFNHGIEREALRVTHEGHLATTPHPPVFGGKLTHPKVTTDFSESQLELITPVHHSPAAALVRRWAFRATPGPTFSFCCRTFALLSDI